MLKSLEVFGFKSFADRTRFEFDSGVTCVVGPNGSGKSNVVDAIKWILGDQSAKSLRGKDMLDVIFNGSAGRKPSGFAEATLTFDNSTGLFPSESTEVQIGRRLYRSGDSEYLLNQAVVRLKDVKDLFMGTGAGTAAYSIIEQGRVDQILQANPTTRRVVFEEAAGISKFKSRRVEAERRLERVEQNLVRFRDIVTHAEAQWHSVQSQAGKATKYREITEELRELWTGLAADEFARFNQRLKQRELEFAEANTTLHSLDESMQRVEREQEAADNELQALESELRELQRAGAVERERMASLESTVRHQTVRCNEITVEVSRLRTRRSRLLVEIHSAVNQRDQSRELLTQLEHEFAKAREAVSAKEAEFSLLNKQVGERRSDIAKRRNEFKEKQQHRGTLQEKLITGKSQLDGTIQSEGEAQLKLEQVERNLQQASAERQTRRQALHEAESSCREAKEQHERLAADRNSLLGQQSQADTLLVELRERRSALQARLSILDELESRQEGIAIGVRDILKRAKSSRYPPWNGVIGLVRDLLDVPLEWAPVVEVALGSRAQLVAIKSLGPLLDYLQRGPAAVEGRVGFLSLQEEGAIVEHTDAGVQRKSAPRMSRLDLTGRPGVIARADEVVAEFEGAAGLARRILGDTWIVDGLDVARALMSELTEPCQFVTQEGELLTADGKVFLGTMPHESSIVSRKSELRQLRNEIHQIERGIESCQDRKEILLETLTTHDDRIDEVAEELRTKSLLVTECATQLTGQDREVERLDRSYAEQFRTVESIFARREELEASVLELEGNLETLDAEIASWSQQVESEEAELQETESILADAQSIIRTEQVSLIKLEERLRGLTESQTQLEEVQRTRQAQLSEVDDQLKESQAALSRAELQILRARADSAIHLVEVERVDGEMRGRAGVRQTLLASRTVASRRKNELQTQSRRLAEARHEIEIDLRDIKQQIQVLDSRIQEEYQVTVQELATSDVSAYRVYLEQLREDNEGLTWEELESSNPYEEVRGELEAAVEKLRRRLKALGHVNTDALDTLTEVEERYTRLATQLQDLEEAKYALETIIGRINAESERIFLDTFEVIRVNFIELFRKLFGGGDADIILEDAEDVLDCGIDIVARPPGKELRSISLLSGGEKTMTAVALLFAMFKSKPSPYCVLDEVDAALDDANVDRYAAVLKEFVNMTQFVVITHRKRTMTAANVLYGVTMEQAGVSKRMSVRFEEVGENGEIHTTRAA
ncbi:MAG: chromosome segregation protein SMC [Planctomycetaceae bacterium]|nr:chromosome segregation protein SMC [Planctomycetaceae bacterium]MCB9951858.1 chromosome segregation protein SMC [Planctomycetaceae bacterium]